MLVGSDMCEEWGILISYKTNNAIFENERSAERLPVIEELLQGWKLQMMTLHELVVRLCLLAVVLLEILGLHEVDQACTSAHQRQQ